MVICKETTNGLQTYIGKNSKENFEIIDQSDPGDIWFHLADGVSSAHAILRIRKDSPKELDIYEAAFFLKESMNKTKNLKTVKIEYIDIKYVKKTKTLGTVKLIKKPMIIKI